ncbi:MAG: peptidoglycan-binding protein [Candidatus Peribacteraceae bacterium]|nr:peptidoglycan-binding protein [Candidatus Peribacteraceae bacterium]
MFIQYWNLRLYPATILLTSLMGSIFSPVYAQEKPHKQEFVVTAYYSPKPDQCCYFRGNYEEEIMFNGKGTNGADGTEVYPGMIAAPSTYQFGTVIELPGLGIGTVHDRGSRITEWGDDVHRIDLWMGEGEEGLARAMTWGVRRVSGIVFPIGSEEMPAEKFSLDTFPADKSGLVALPKSDPVLLMATTKFGDDTYAVRILQSTLRSLGYFTGSSTGQYGSVTQSAVKLFLDDYKLPGDGSSVDRTAAASLTIASSIKSSNLPDITVGLRQGAKGKDVAKAQRVLRYLGAYRGRTSGVYDSHFKDAVFAFQQSNSLVSGLGDAGAGVIGPRTTETILKAWKAKIASKRAQAMVLKMEVADVVRASALPAKVLARGDRGKDVSKLQKLLNDMGYLRDEDVTGTFAQRTEAALRQYQLDRKIVASEEARGFGVFGPSTKALIAGEAVEVAWRQVRAGGMKNL